MADPARKPDISTHFNDFGALPSSPLDSHHDSEPAGIAHGDFGKFPTRFMPILIGSRPGRPEIDQKSTGKSLGNRPRSQKAPSSRKRSHQNSVQTGLVDKFKALTATIFETISAFVSRAHFWASGTDPGGPGPTLGVSRRSQQPLRSCRMY